MWGWSLQVDIAPVTPSDSASVKIIPVHLWIYLGTTGNTSTYLYLRWYVVIRKNLS